MGVGPSVATVKKHSIPGLVETSLPMFEPPVPNKAMKEAELVKVYRHRTHMVQPEHWPTTACWRFNCIAGDSAARLHCSRFVLKCFLTIGTLPPIDATLAKELNALTTENAQHNIIYPQHTADCPVDCFIHHSYFTTPSSSPAITADPTRHQSAAPICRSVYSPSDSETVMVDDNSSSPLDQTQCDRCRITGFVHDDMTITRRQVQIHPDVHRYQLVTLRLCPACENEEFKFERHSTDTEDQRYLRQQIETARDVTADLITTLSRKRRIDRISVDQVQECHEEKEKLISSFDRWANHENWLQYKKILDEVIYRNTTVEDHLYQIVVEFYQEFNTNIKAKPLTDYLQATDNNNNNTDAIVPRSLLCFSIPETMELNRTIRWLVRWIVWDRCLQQIRWWKGTVFERECDYLGDWNEAVVKAAVLSIVNSLSPLVYLTAGDFGRFNANTTSWKLILAIIQFAAMHTESIRIYIPETRLLAALKQIVGKASFVTNKKNKALEPMQSALRSEVARARQLLQAKSKGKEVYFYPDMLEDGENEKSAFVRKGAIKYKKKGRKNELVWEDDDGRQDITDLMFEHAKRLVTPKATGKELENAQQRAVDSVMLSSFRRRMKGGLKSKFIDIIDECANLYHAELSHVSLMPIVIVNIILDYQADYMTETLPLIGRYYHRVVRQFAESDLRRFKSNKRTTLVRKEPPKATTKEILEQFQKQEAKKIADEDSKRHEKIRVYERFILNWEPQTFPSPKIFHLPESDSTFTGMIVACLRDSELWEDAIAAPNFTNHRAYVIGALAAAFPILDHIRMCVSPNSGRVGFTDNRFQAKFIVDEFTSHTRIRDILDNPRTSGTSHVHATELRSDYRFNYMLAELLIRADSCCLKLWELYEKVRELPAVLNLFANQLRARLTDTTSPWNYSFVVLDVTQKCIRELIHRIKQGRPHEHAWTALLNCGSSDAACVFIQAAFHGVTKKIVNSVYKETESKVESFDAFLTSGRKLSGPNRKQQIRDHIYWINDPVPSASSSSSSSSAIAAASAKQKKTAKLTQLEKLKRLNQWLQSH